MTVMTKEAEAYLFIRTYVRIFLTRARIVTHDSVILCHDVDDAMTRCEGK